jgi:hypothetical protein
MNTSKKNYIKIAMPVAKHTAEYASKCCLKGILSAWDFIKGFYRYEYIYWRLKNFSRSTRLTFKTFLDPGCNCSLSDQCTVSQYLSLALLSQYLSLALLSHSHRKQGNFVCPLCCPGNNPMTFRSPHISNFRRDLLIAYLEVVCYECTGQNSTTI